MPKDWLNDQWLDDLCDFQETFVPAICQFRQTLYNVLIKRFQDRAEQIDVLETSNCPERFEQV